MSKYIDLIPVETAIAIVEYALETGQSWRHLLSYTPAYRIEEDAIHKALPQKEHNYTFFDEVDKC